MYGVSRVNVEGEPPSTFTFTRGLSYIASILFMLVKFTCVAVQVYVRTNCATVEIHPYTATLG